MALSFAHGAVQWLSSDTVNTTYTVSGLSFQPKAIRFYWTGLQSATDAVSQAVSARRGIGFASSTSSRRCVGTISIDTSANADTDCVAANDCIAVTTSGAGAIDGKLDLNSISSDGFQLIVDDQVPASITVFWEAWGGSDIDTVTIGDIAEPAATGTQNYTATGFTSTGTDQVVMFAGVQSTAAVGTAQVNDSGLCVGFTTGTATANNIVLVGNSDEASATMDTDGYNYTGDCLAMIVVAGGNPDARATLSAWGTDLFTLNWTARATTNRRYVYMAIKGGQWTAGALTIAANTANATSTVSGLDYIPLGVSLLGAGKTISTAGTATAQDMVALGSGSAAYSRRSQGVLDEDATATTETNHTVDYDSVLSYPTNAGALDTAIDINSFNSDGFQLIVDTAGGVASEWVGYLTFGNEVTLVDGLVSYWRLDESSGNASDAIGGRTLTNTGTATYTTGKINNCVDLNGTSQYLTRTSGSIGIANKWTIAGWVYFDATGSVDMIWTFDAASDINRIAVNKTSGDKLRVVLVGSGGSTYKDYEGNTTLSSATWYFMVVTYDGTTLNLYVNNTLQTPTKTLDQAVTQTNTNRTIYFGMSNDGTSNGLDGKIDETAIWGRVLSTAEITALYNSGSGLAYEFNFGVVRTLIVGGGGGGGCGASRQGGGGGAGAVIEKTALAITPGAYTITVGGGGAGATGTGANGINGDNSSAFGLIAFGGGGGASNFNGTGNNGGSGGGGSGGTTGTTHGAGGIGSPVFGYNGAQGAGSTTASRGGGGGGGASAAGSGLTANGGDGGAGISSDISGSSVSYGGGGGGGGSAGGNGGTGGGGHGVDSVGTSGTAGTANTGGGGGGGGAATASGYAGGSGVVIISYRTDGSDGISNTSTGGTITTSGSYTIHTFTSSGTFTAVAYSAYTPRLFALLGVGN